MSRIQNYKMELDVRQEFCKNYATMVDNMMHMKKHKADLDFYHNYPEIAKRQFYDNYVMLWKRQQIYLQDRQMNTMIDMYCKQMPRVQNIPVYNPCKKYECYYNKFGGFVNGCMKNIQESSQEITNYFDL